MIPRYQRILYWCLVGGIALMALLLVRGCVTKHERIAAMRDQSPIAAPSDIPSEQVSIASANDADGSISLDEVNLPLPEEPSLRARVLLDRALTDLSLPASTHPVPPGPAVTDVFLLSLPIGNPAGISYPAAGSQLAVVNLTKAFADAHPSGIESEDLTLRVIIATLHANFPDIREVRFLVDGQPRDTLSGHSDLSRPYAVTDPTQSIHVLAADGSSL